MCVVVLCWIDHVWSSKATTSNPQQLPLTLGKRNLVNSICKAIVCMVKRILAIHIPILPCVSSTLKEVQRIVLKVLHEKQCRASLVSGKCDRNRCYFYHVTGSARSNHMNVTSNPQNKMHGSNYHPTPLMQVSVPPPHVHKPVSNAPPTNTASPPAQTPISDPQPAHTTSFLEELKEIRSQMVQMQQTQNLLMQNQMWPPLPSQKPRHLPNQMF